MKVAVGPILPKFLWQNFPLAQVTFPAGFEFCISVQVIDVDVDVDDDDDDDDAEQVVDGRHQLKKEINANALCLNFFSNSNKAFFPLKMFRHVSGKLVTRLKPVITKAILNTQVAKRFL